MNSTRVSPAWTEPGRVTVWLRRFPKELAVPTWDKVGSAASARGTAPRPTNGSSAESAATRKTVRLRARTATNC